MAAQENVALARSLIDLQNNRQSDPAWLDKGMAAFAADAEDVDVPSGTTLQGPDGHKRIALFFAENFPEMRVELSNAFATEDQVVLEGTSRWNDTGPLHLASGDLPSMRRSCELRCCLVFEFRNGKIANHHGYYEMLTLMEQLGLAPVTGQATW